MSSDSRSEEIKHLNRRLTTLIGYQFIVFGMLGFLMMSELGEPSRGADLFIISVGLGVLYHVSDQIYHGYAKIKEFIGGGV
jgi:hypothetical protein